MSPVSCLRFERRSAEPKTPSITRLARQNTQIITELRREQLIRKLQSLFPGDLTVIQCSGKWRTRLCFRTGRCISVLVAKTVRPWKAAIRWQVDPVPAERRFVTLLVRLDIQNISVQDYDLVPKIDYTRRFTLKLQDSWLERGERLGCLEDFGEVVKRVCVRAEPAPDKIVLVR